MGLLRSPALGLVVAGMLFGCGSDPVAPGADSGVADTGTGGDTGATADTGGPPVISAIYGACRSNSECQEGLTCRTEAAEGNPGGECSRECTRDDECVLPAMEGRGAVDGYCRLDRRTMRRSCFRVCVNGSDCERDGYTCVSETIPGQIVATQYCIPVCTDESCVNGTVCDHESGRCRPRDAMITGRRVGESCVPEGRDGATMANRCISNLCIAGSNPDSRGVPVYSGWNDGYCRANCIVPEGYNPTNYFDGREFPRSNCPMGAICRPASELAPRNWGICFKECRQNSDCRVDQGYTCQKSITIGSGTTARTIRWDNGWCTPVNCANTMTPCPTGFTCQRQTATSSICVPMAMGTP